METTEKNDNNHNLKKIVFSKQVISSLIGFKQNVSKLFNRSLGLGHHCQVANDCIYLLSGADQGILKGGCINVSQGAKGCLRPWRGHGAEPREWGPWGQIPPEEKGFSNRQL